MANGVIATEEVAFRMRWSAIFAGTVVAFGLWVLLYALGMAIGLTAIEPGQSGSLRGIGIGTGVWSVIAPLIALFAGGFVAARTAGILDRTTGALHGAVMWGLTCLVGTFFVMSALLSAVTAGVKMGGAAMSGAAGVGQAGGALGVDVGDLLGPINQRLRAEGLPPVSEGQLQAALRDAANQAAREGRLDRAALVDAIARNTNLERHEAGELATRVEQAWGQAASGVRRGAMQAAETTGKVFWGVFVALLLGLFSAVAGAFAGTSLRQRVAAERPTPAPAPGPITPERRIPVETRP